MNRFETHHQHLSVNNRVAESRWQEEGGLIPNLFTDPRIHAAKRHIYNI